MNAQASRITSLTIVYSPVYLDADQRKHQSSASLAFVWGIHRGPVNSSHKGPVKRKMFPFDDGIMITVITHSRSYLSPNCQDDRVCRATSHLFGSHETCIQKINISPRDHIWDAFWLCPIRLECRWAAAHHHSAGRDQFWYAPSQWETSLHCNDVSNCVHSFIHSFIHSYIHSCVQVIMKICILWSFIVHCWQINLLLHCRHTISQVRTVQILCLLLHDDIMKRKHFPRYWPFVRGIHRWPVNSPYKGQWRRALMFSLIYAGINFWVNNREAGDLRCHRAHYDALQWRHNGRDSVTNHQPHDCLLNRLFRRRSKKTSKLSVAGLCAGNSPHKWPVTWIFFHLVTSSWSL